jgi:hypothetical protein
VIYPAYDDLRPIPASNFGGLRPRGVLGCAQHTMVGTIASATARFRNATSIVSATFGVGLSGRIVLWVSLDRIAYANGNWTANEDLASVEHEDAGRYWDAERTPELYLASGALNRAIAEDRGYAIDDEHLPPHNRLAATACPDALDVARIIAIAEGEPMYVEQEVFDQYVKDVALTFDAIKALLNPLAAWAAGAPELPKGTALKRHMRVLELAVKPPKIQKRRTRRRAKKPAGAPPRLAVLAGHGKGS